jgi:membrane protein
VSRVVHYWAVITLGPLVILLVVGVMSGEKFAASQRWLAELPMVGRVGLAWTMRLLPYLLLSAAFWLFYLLMPNTKVRWTAALVGGVVGGCLWQLNNEFSVLYVSNVVTYSKMYGSLGILPVFLVGLYFSWLILLFGAQISYSFQNRHACLQTILANQINQQGREFIALRLMAHIGGRYQEGATALSAQALAVALRVPTRLAGEILSRLVLAGLLLEVRGHEGGFVPARPLRQIGCLDILQALRKGQGSQGLKGTEPTLDRVRREYERIGAAECNAASQTTLLDLVDATRSNESKSSAATPHV